jgi:putative hydrolase of the HAD superfamily
MPKAQTVKKFHEGMPESLPARTAASRVSSLCCSHALALARHLEELLAQISTIFWDVGGVLLTDAWDRSQRKLALEQFKLDEQEFSDRHEAMVSPLERGKIGFDEYLNRTIFYRPRPFAREVFKDYVFSLSQPHRDVIALAEELVRTSRYLMGTINNESRELNLYRIHTFGLREIFSVFVSSCFVGLRKPEESIYQLALELTQKTPAECCFIDDRVANLELPGKMGMHPIEMHDVEQLRRDLRKLEIKI